MNKTTTHERPRCRPRRRVKPLWRSRPVLVLVAALVIGGAVASSWWLWKNGMVASYAERVKWKLIAMTGDLGFTVKEVMVVGRRHTLRKDLLKAVRSARGAPILALDIEGAKKRLEELPWVRSASVERMLPDTILLSVTERTPLAIWQNKGRFYLIDREGDVILENEVRQFSDLPVVVGEKAAAHAAELMAMLGRQPRLMELVKAAVWVGDRRWNIQLANGIDVRLPETNPASAWARLAEYERRNKILKLDIKVLDLRIPDRLIVRRAGQSVETVNKPGQET